MPTLVEYVCQHCRARSKVRAAIRPPAMQPCPKCEGHRQAIRLVTGREARKTLHKSAQARL